METFKWWLCFFIGVGVLAMFAWIVFHKQREFDAPLLGLLTLGLFIILISIVQPDSIKYGDLELSKLKREAQQVTKEAKESIKLALETTAMLTWNAGRWGDGQTNNEEIATNILKRLYGDKATQYRFFLQRQGVFQTPANELLQVPNVDIPNGINSPLYESFLKSERSNKTLQENK